jgi:hypothetical protein
VWLEVPPPNLTGQQIDVDSRPGVLAQLHELLDEIVRLPDVFQGKTERERG